MPTRVRSTEILAAVFASAAAATLAACDALSPKAPRPALITGGARWDFELPAPWVLNREAESRLQWKTPSESAPLRLEDRVPKCAAWPPLASHVRLRVQACRKGRDGKTEACRLFEFSAPVDPARCTDTASPDTVERVSFAQNAQESPRR